jgi:parvulin-like peptidyl-prolyl isomerase
MLFILSSRACFAASTDLILTHTINLSKPSEAVGRAYLELYKSSVIRNLRFDQQADPDAAAREEAYIEQQLTKSAEQSGLANDRALQADVRYYQKRELLNQWLNAKVPEDSVTSEAVRSYYEAHKNQYVRAATVTFHHLFLLVPPDNPEIEKQKKEQAERIYRMLSRNADFETLIKENSDIGKTSQSGVVGPVEMRRLNPLIVSVLSKLTSGSVSSPLRTAYGWEILRLDDFKATSTIPFAAAHKEIQQTLRLQKASDLESHAAKLLEAEYPSKKNEVLLSSSEPLSSQSLVFSIGDRKFLAEEVLEDIHATWAYEKIKDPKERIRAALPRLILTEQVLQDAKKSGLLYLDSVQLAFRLIRNRLLGERYYKNYKTQREPTEKQIAEFYTSHKEQFRKPSMAQGEVYKWVLSQNDQTSVSSPAMRYELQALKQKVDKIQQNAANGEVGRGELEKSADNKEVLDWFQEGRNGYDFDRAFFATEAGHYTGVFPIPFGWAIGWVENKKPGEAVSPGEAKDTARKLLIRKWSEEEKAEMIQKLLRDYSLAQ